MEPNEDLVSPNRATRTKELDSYKSDDGALGSDGECKGEKEKIAARPIDKEQLQHTAPQRCQPDRSGTLDFLLDSCYCDLDVNISVAR